MSSYTPQAPRDSQPTWGNTYEERLLSQALRAADTPGAVLSASVRPPLAQIDPWRPRWGYRQTVPGILDVIDVSRLYKDRRDAWSGGPNDFAATSRPALGTSY